MIYRPLHVTVSGQNIWRIKNIYVAHLKRNFSDISFSWCDLFLNGRARIWSFISRGNLALWALSSYQTLAILAVWMQILSKEDNLECLVILCRKCWHASKERSSIGVKTELWSPILNPTLLSCVHWTTERSNFSEFSQSPICIYMYLLFLHLHHGGACCFQRISIR